MLATDGQKSDLTNHWPRNSRGIDTLMRLCRCPVAITPRQVKPGALVALVDDLGRVQLLFRLARIESSANLLAADGVWSGGNYLVARSGTMRRPGPRDPARLPVNRHALGQFAYFDARTRESVLYSQPDNSRSAVAMTLATGPAPRKLHPFFANNIGKTLRQPERALIQAYVEWAHAARFVGHYHLRGPGVYTDVFLPSRWTLFEAKATARREVIRSALGQLLDYQRCFPRRPRLALLLPERPTETMLDLLGAKRVAVVWRSTGGSFKDTVGGKFTTVLRQANDEVP